MINLIRLSGFLAICDMSRVLKTLCYIYIIEMIDYKLKLYIFHFSIYYFSDLSKQYLMAIS